MYVLILRKAPFLPCYSSQLNNSQKRHALSICTICTQFTNFNNSIFNCAKAGSESKFLEEEIHSWLLFVALIRCIISLSEDVLDLVLQLLPGFLIRQFVFSNDILEL